MENVRECLILVYFSCLFFNVWLVNYDKCFLLRDIFAFWFGSFLLINEEPLYISLSEYESPCKKRKLRPIDDLEEQHIWHDDYWYVYP